MARRFTSVLPSFVLLWLLAALAESRTAAETAPAQVRVGVILDQASVRGARWRTSIRMAVEDYYAAHPNSTTRLELHFRDSAGDAVAAVSAAVDLIKNAQVQALIGPQTAAGTEFIAHIGERTHVPVLSYSATSPALSPSRSSTPFLVRACADDSFQAAPIAGILRSFSWREATLVHEDSRFGAGIVPALADALRGAGASLAHRAEVPPDASDDRLDAVLYRVSATTTRVFVVHMSPSLALRMFHRAKNAGVMSEGYVWIATAGVGGMVDTLSPEDIDAVQGVVSVRPYVQPTSQNNDFAERFKARFQQENAGFEDIRDPTVSMLWAYDTAWVVAAAADAAGVSDSAFKPSEGSTGLTELDQIGVSATGETLLKAIHDTTFDGLAGKFRLVNGKLPTPAYEIINIVGEGAKTVGFWTSKSGMSPEFDADSGEGLKKISFPGAEKSDIQIPRGWAFSPVGQELVIAVPVKHGFHQFVQVYNDTTTNRTMISGFCIDVFDAAIKALPYPVYYRYEPFYSIGSNSNYDQLIDLIPQQRANAVVGDVAITASRMAKVDFTMPFTESGWSMVVAVQAQSSTSMFFFLKPLTPGLWLVSLAAFIFTGFVIWVIEHRINPEFRGTPLQQFGIIFHYAFSTLVFAQRENVQSNLSKFLMVIWLFAVLILTSSYTASMTSMLTVQKLKSAVTDISDLIKNGEYIGYQEGSFVAGELVKMNFDQIKLRSYSTVEEYADALSKGSDNGGVAAVFDEVPYLRIFLSQYCDGYAMSGPVYKGTGLAFVFPEGSPMGPDVSRAIVGMTENDMGLERKWFGAPGACGDGVDASNASLTLWNFSGLFLITGVASSLMLIIYLVMFVYREHDELRAAEPGSGSVSLKRVRAWLKHYDRKDMTAPHFKQRFWSGSPSRNGSSHGKQRERAEQEEATPTREHSGPGATPLSDHSRMGSASPLERKASNDFRTPFEQRMGDAAAAASTEKRASTPERKPSLKLPQNTEERKNLPLSP